MDAPDDFEVVWTENLVRYYCYTPELRDACMNMIGRVQRCGAGKKAAEYFGVREEEGAEVSIGFEEVVSGETRVVRKGGRVYCQHPLIGKGGDFRILLRRDPYIPRRFYFEGFFDVRGDGHDRWTEFVIRKQREYWADYRDTHGVAFGAVPTNDVCYWNVFERRPNAVLWLAEQGVGQVDDENLDMIEQKDLKKPQHWKT